MDEYLKKLNIADSPKEHKRLFIETCNMYNTLDIELLNKAFFYCYFFHRKDNRKDGTRYYLHPLQAAFYLVEIFRFYDTQSIIACLLHDAVEEAKNEHINLYRRNKILEVFGEDVLNLVLQVTKIKTKKNVESISFATLMLSMIRDIRIILIKLSDRLHNLDTLAGHKEDKRKEIAEETLKFFVPIAQWLGIRNVKQIIEEICFENLDAKTYQEIKNYREEQKEKFAEYIKNLEGNLYTKLENHKIKAVITTEHKTSYEIYELAKRHNIEYDRIENIFSMVLALVENQDEDSFINCYKTLGVLNKYFTVIEERDYIRNPKFNNFQSIITYIYSENRRTVEILIRTEEMDDIANNGALEEIKKNKRYKTLDLNDNDIEQLEKWINDLINEKGEDARFVIWDLMRINYYSQEINVLTGGKRYKLPKDTALINLAFLIDDSKALYIDLDKTTVNEKKAYYNTILKENDKIELRYTNHITATEDWAKHLTLFLPIVRYYEYKNQKK